MHGAKYESTGFTDSASAVCIILLCMYAYIIMYDVLQLAAICTVLVVVYTTTTKYRDATVVTARFLLWRGGLNRSLVVVALNYPRSLV